MSTDLRHQRLLLRSAFALAALVYLGMIVLPTHLLVGICVADDAFYYQTIARNIASGLGSTFDGKNPTNGYHPLFMAVQIVLWKLAPAPLGTVPLRCGLALLALASLGTGWLVFDLVRRRLGRAAATVTALLWLGNPFVLLTTHAGVEAPLATCALAACLWWWNLRCADAPTTARPWVVLGILLGVAGLARTDSLLAGGVLLGFALSRQWRMHGWRSSARAFTATALPALSLVLPWLLWCWLRFGHLVQDSGRALSGYTWQAVWAAPDTGTKVLLLALGLVSVATGVARIAGGNGIITVLGLGTLLLVLAARRRRLTAAEPAAGASPLLAPFLLAAATIVLFYGLVFRFHQPWYLLTVWLALAVLGGHVQAHLVELASAADQAVGRPSWWRGGQRVLAALGLPALAMAIYVPTAVHELRTGVYPWQQTYLELGHRLRMGMPGRLGSFNAGIYGFFSNAPVVNLDGVVNGRAALAMRERRLLGYLREERVQFVLDHESTLRDRARWAEPELMQALVPLASFPNASNGGPIVLWRVRGARTLAGDGE